MPKKIKITKARAKRYSETTYERLRNLYKIYEIYGKYLRQKGAPAYQYKAVFSAQSKIVPAIKAIREVIGTF